MTKDIILTISGLHATDGEADAPVEIMTPGQYFLKSGKHYVVYDEVIEGLEGTVKSTIKFTETTVELMRNGAASTRMVFEQDKEYKVLYQMPMGPLDISLYTENMDVNLQEEKIELKINYSLKAEEQVITESSVHMEICPKELKKFEN